MLLGAVPLRGIEALYRKPHTSIPHCLRHSCLAHSLRHGDAYWSNFHGQGSDARTRLIFVIEPFGSESDGPRGIDYLAR